MWFCLTGVACCGCLIDEAEIIGEVWIAHSFWVPVLETDFCPLYVIANLLMIRWCIWSVTCLEPSNFFLCSF